MIEKFTFDLQAPRIKQRTKLILVKAESETREHIVLKLLAYLIFYDPRLRVEAVVDLHYQPDLSIEKEHGGLELWVDCGYIAMKKAEKVPKKLKNTRVVFMKKTLREMEQFKRSVSEETLVCKNLQILAFDPGFVEGIAGAVERTNEITMYPVMENVVGLAVNEQVFESQLHWSPAPA